MDYLFLSESSLPGDIILEILVCLDLKGVTLMKIVSKNWNRSISNPTFHKLRLQFNGEKGYSLFIQRMIIDN